VTECSAESSEVDELKELELRTGLVNKKVSRMRMPALRAPGELRRKTVAKKLTFAGDKEGRSTIAAQVNHGSETGDQ